MSKRLLPLRMSCCYEYQPNHLPLVTLATKLGRTPMYKSPGRPSTLKCWMHFQHHLLMEAYLLLPLGHYFPGTDKRINQKEHTKLQLITKEYIRNERPKMFCTLETSGLELSASPTSTVFLLPCIQKQRK